MIDPGESPRAFRLFIEFIHDRVFLEAGARRLERGGIAFEASAANQMG
jgi:hypothetical protein